MAVLFEHKAAKVLYIEEHTSSVTMVYVSGGGTSRYTRNFPALLIAESQLRYEVGRSILKAKLHPLEFAFASCTEFTTRDLTAHELNLTAHELNWRWFRHDTGWCST